MGSKVQRFRVQRFRGSGFRVQRFTGSKVQGSEVHGSSIIIGLHLGYVLGRKSSVSSDLIQNLALCARILC